LENKSLEDELKLRGALFDKNENLTPEVKNQFLKNVMSFEEAEESGQIPMRSLFPARYPDQTHGRRGFSGPECSVHRCNRLYSPIAGKPCFFRKQGKAFSVSRCAGAPL
jgi:hypothetical protein